MSLPVNKPVVGLETDLDPQAIKFTVGTESGNVITTALQVTEHGKNCSANGTSTYDSNRKRLNVWLASDSDGDTMVQANTSFTVSVGAEFKEVQAEKEYIVLTNTSGAVTIAVGDTGTSTIYLCAEIGGQVYIATLPFA